MAALRHRVSTLRPTAAAKESFDNPWISSTTYKRKWAQRTSATHPSRQVNLAAEICFLGSEVQRGSCVGYLSGPNYKLKCFNEYCI